MISVICFISAAYVAANGNEGWGWLIFAGIMALGYKM